MTKPENTPRQEANKQRFLAWVKKRVEESKTETSDDQPPPVLVDILDQPSRSRL